MTGLMGTKGKIALLHGGCAIIGLVLGAGLAYGSGDNAVAHESGTVLIARLINFALLFIILLVIIKKTDIKGFFATRREGIRQKLDSLTRQKNETEIRCQELEQKLEEFEQKKKEIIEQFKADGEEEKKRIISRAHGRAKQILEQVDLTIKGEIQEARDSLRQELVEIAAQKAQAIIARDLTDSDQDHLVNEFIDRVEKLH